MKKVILGSVLAVAALTSVPANAAIVSICSGGVVAQNGASVTAASAASVTGYVRASFIPKCSANVNMVGDDNGSYYRVASSSLKGTESYAISTINGTTVKAQCSTTPGGLCVATSASGAVTTAATI